MTTTELPRDQLAAIGLASLATKADLAKLEGELNAKMEKMAGELKTEMAELKTEMAELAGQNHKAANRTLLSIAAGVAVIVIANMLTQ